MRGGCTRRQQKKKEGDGGRSTQERVLDSINIDPQDILNDLLRPPDHPLALPRIGLVLIAWPVGPILRARTAPLELVRPRSGRPGIRRATRKVVQGHIEAHGGLVSPKEAAVGEGGKEGRVRGCRGLREGLVNRVLELAVRSGDGDREREGGGDDVAWGGGGDEQRPAVLGY